MKGKAILKRLGALLLVGAMAVAPSVTVFAAPEDIVDTGKNGSITIHKYDLTAASEDGIDITNSGFANNGKQDATAEDTMKDYVIPDVEFSYVKVGDINTKSDKGNISVLYDIPQNLATTLGLEAKAEDGLKFTSDELNHALTELLANNTDGKNALEKCITEIGGQQAMNRTDSNGVTTIDGLKVGLYLIVETKVPANVQSTVNPFFVSIPMTDNEGESWFYDVHVYPKNQTDIPDLDKLVRQHDDVGYGKPEFADTATGSEGDVMDYIFVSHLPNITSSATYLKKYTFLDKMDKGLTYNKDTAIYFYDNVEDARANNTEKAKYTWAAGSPNFAVKYGTPDQPTYQMEVSMTEAGLAAINKKADGLDTSEYSKLWMVVSYSATVNSDETPILGDHGNLNDVTLTWERTNMPHDDVLVDRVKVYTYALNIKKNFDTTDEGKPGSPLDVRFSLQNKTDGHYVTAIPGKKAGTYHVVDSKKLDSETVMSTLDKASSTKAFAEAGIYVPAQDGSLVIEGLEANEYVLTELETSDGYSLLKEPITIVINCTEDNITPSMTTLYDSKDIAANTEAGHDNVIDTAGKRASATVDGKDTNMSDYRSESDLVSTHGRVDMTILNSRTFQLPQTGGMGTILFTLGGMAAACAGIAVVSKKSKKENNEA